MSKDEISLEEKLTASLSKENINRQIIATLLHGDTPEQLAGALFIVSTLYNEALDLLIKLQDRVKLEDNYSKNLMYLFKATDQHRQRGLKFKPKRESGSSAANTKYIERLVAQNPNSSAKQLEKIAKENKTGNIKSSTFANKVSKAKNKKN